MTAEFTGKGSPLSQNGLDTALHQLGCDKESLWALVTVETSGFGFLPDRRPKILYERHIFHQLTKGAYDDVPDLSSVMRGGYFGGAAEYDRLARAMNLDADAALESVSWGLGQIMGFNAASLGYRGARDMIAQFQQGEDAQLDGIARFLKATPALRAAFLAKAWKTVAFYYNGSDYAKKEYDAKLAYSYDLYQQHGCPDVGIRAAQACLAYLGYDPHGVDGLRGKHTLAALNAFQAANGMPASAAIDQAGIDAVLLAAGV